MTSVPATTAGINAEFGHLISAVGTLPEASGVLFDFNGTLSDDEGILEQLFIELAAGECGLTLTKEQYRSELHGRSDLEISEAIMALAGSLAVPVKGFLRLLDARYNEEISRHSPISSDTRDLIFALHHEGLRLGIVTGAGRATVLPALERSGLLAMFGVVISQEDVTAGKPDPEGLLKGARALGLADTNRVVVFEDSIPGLHAVSAAGMVPVAVNGLVARESILPLAAVVVDRLAPGCMSMPLRPGAAL
ncbi:HAD family hydrolase [Pseudarthrobacter sp. P1]|uniref:HAD family hydrolase n=1 Tax=Pseudarthrobacter sp. P1 TaxID=3418418 RepID=UPI003CEEBB16